MTKKAVVLEVKDRTCTVLTADGEFREIKRRGDHGPGQQILVPSAVFDVGKYSLVAACLLLFLVAGTLLGRWTKPAVAAYVSLDINPSVEMALDVENVVIEIDPLNDDGRDLIAGLTIKGLRVEEAVERLVAAAVEKEFINSGEENVILSAVTPLAGDADRVETLVMESIKLSVDKNSVSAQILVGEVVPENREKASKAGISAGRYMIFLDVSKESRDVKLEDLKDKNKFKSEINKKIKNERVSGVKPEEVWKINSTFKPGDDGGRSGEGKGGKQGKEGGQGGGQGTDKGRGRGNDAPPASIDSARGPGSKNNKVQGSNEAGEEKTAGPARGEKEKYKNKEKGSEKDKGKDNSKVSEWELKNGTAGSHGEDSSRQKVEERD